MKELNAKELNGLYAPLRHENVRAWPKDLGYAEDCKNNTSSFWTPSGCLQPAQRVSDAIAAAMLFHAAYTCLTRRLAFAPVMACYRVSGFEEPQWFANGLFPPNYPTEHHALMEFFNGKIPGPQPKEFPETVSQVAEGAD